ncbi:uncharacterized protein F4812DRAFT_390764 [Daldinia caldariorum]|uniref:uncharacterized protein n=1 Tax=Daldinia caldariorum TaxID=326644 RepID=UPI002008C676|nr:uncharacterized protein F4812DRAFT_390764 [Daldinia caldariorum]KAI1468102.1 hypothetical protein F4812DRAFT_390764 [Daldinia caldariorum]
MSLAPAVSIKSSREKDSTPELKETNRNTKSDSTSTITDNNEKEMESDSNKTDPKTKKRSLFGFGKKKGDTKPGAKPSPQPTSGLPNSPSARDVPPTPAKRSVTSSPNRTGSPNITPSSPSRGLYSSSPRLSSPAGSQIFERDVQESAAVIPNSPAIPSHIQTENYIPPVLDASSEAITDEHLNPDSVEIVTHNAHQPASVTVTGASQYETSSNSWAEDLAAFSDKEEAASNYGSLDSADVRRLSFISFADVVQAEQVPPNSSRDSMHLAGLTSIGSRGVNRSPSPIRSPVSSQGPETSPPNSISGSIKGLSMSPVRKPLGSPTSVEHSLSVNGDLNIETMSQALRRTGSTDLSIARSLPVSPVEGPSR